MQNAAKMCRAVFFAALIVSVGAQASDSQKKQAEEIGKAAGHKVVFVNDLALVDDAAITLAQLALERSSDARVREFAQKLLDDHQQHLSDLRDWATSKSIEISVVMDSAGTPAGTGGSGINAANRAMDKDMKKTDKVVDKFDENYVKLSQKTGNEFDRDFAKMAAKVDEKGVDMSKKGEKEYRSDATFAAFLLKSRPVMESHVSEAKALEKSLKKG